MPSKIETLKKRKEEIDRQLKELALKEVRRAATNGKRQKIILDEWLIENRPDVVNKIVLERLKREQDKKAFCGWESLPPLKAEIQGQ